VQWQCQLGVTKGWQVWEVLLELEEEMALAWAVVEEPPLAVVPMRLGRAGVEVRALWRAEVRGL